ncbi:MAG: hypothetical protein ACI9N9_001653 [Enterobacterales bacterium]|jgi:hypothetical protein
MYHAIIQRRQTMSKILSTLLVATLLLTPCPISANESTAQNRHDMRELKQQQNELKAKQRLLRLKTSLNLQQDQAQAWDEYKTSILNNINQKREMTTQLRQKYRNTNQKPNALELAQANISRQESKLAKAKQQYADLEVFYGHLNGEQQKIIDKVVQRKIKNEAKKLRKMHKGQKERSNN